jgi:hypothetical protein
LMFAFRRRSPLARRRGRRSADFVKEVRSGRGRPSETERSCSPKHRNLGKCGKTAIKAGWVSRPAGVPQIFSFERRCADSCQAMCIGPLVEPRVVAHLRNTWRCWMQHRILSTGNCEPLHGARLAGADRLTLWATAPRPLRWDAESRGRR